MKTTGQLFCSLMTNGNLFKSFEKIRLTEMCGQKYKEINTIRKYNDVLIK